MDNVKSENIVQSREWQVITRIKVIVEEMPEREALAGYKCYRVAVRDAFNGISYLNINLVQDEEGKRQPLTIDQAEKLFNRIICNPFKYLHVTTEARDGYEWGIIGIDEVKRK